MEEEKADALEVAAQENEEGKAQKAEAKVSLFWNNSLITNKGFKSLTIG